MAQAMEYEGWDDASDRVRRFFNEIGQTHTLRGQAGVGGHEVGPERGVRPHRPRRVPHARPGHRRPRGGSDAIDFYAERFRAIFRDVGDNVTKLGNQVGGVANRWPTGSARGAAQATARADAAARRRATCRESGPDGPSWPRGWARSASSLATTGPATSRPAGRCCVAAAHSLTERQVRYIVIYRELEGPMTRRRGFPLPDGLERMVALRHMGVRPFGGGRGRGGAARCAPRC